MDSAKVVYLQSDPSYREELGENQSTIKHILKSPAHYKAAKERKFFPSENMQIGSAVHALVLEGRDVFNRHYVEKPANIKLNTVKGKEWKKMYSRYTILSPEAMEKVEGMAESLARVGYFDSQAEDYHKYNEVSIYWDSDHIKCKARLDRVVDHGDSVTVVDLKSTLSIDPYQFLKKCVDLNYIFQSGWYTEAAQRAYEKKAEFVFVAVEREAPYDTAVFEISDAMMREAYRQTELARQILRGCLRDSMWPRPQVSQGVLDLPKWFEFPQKRSLDYCSTEDSFKDLF